MKAESNPPPHRSVFFFSVVEALLRSPSRSPSFFVGGAGAVGTAFGFTSWFTKLQQCFVALLFCRFAVLVCSGVIGVLVCCFTGFVVLMCRCFVVLLRWRFAVSLFC